MPSKKIEKIEIEELIKEINTGLSIGEKFIKATEQPRDKVIPTGSFSLDIALGTGGWRMGHFSEIYGPEGTGKSFLSLLTIKEAQKIFPDKYIIYYDAEHSFNLQMAQNLGINLDKVLINKMNNAKKIFSSMLKFLESGEVSLIVVDSVASIVTESEEDEQANVEKVMVGSLARVMSQVVKKVSPVLSGCDTVVLLLNQIRESINPYGGGMDSPGGNALKHMTVARVQLNFASALDTIEDKITLSPRSGNKALILDDYGRAIGARIHAVVKKSKGGPRNSSAFYDAYWLYGICHEGEVIDLAVLYNIVDLVNKWYSYNGQKFAHGRKQAIKKLVEDKELCIELKKKILEKVGIGDYNVEN